MSVLNIKDNIKGISIKTDVDGEDVI